MTANARPPIAVLGAGVAGLVAARTLRRQGHDVVVYEAGAQVAGLAASHADADGFHYDTGAHFITNRLAAEVGIADRCRVVRRYGEAVWLDGKVRGYPLGLLVSPKYTTSAIAAKLTPSKGEPVTADAWFRAAYGRALADEIALPLVEAWSGAPASELSASVGSKIPGSLAQTIALRAASRLTRRAVAIGYCGSRPQSPKVWHVYPEGGVSTVCQALADELGDAVRLESPVSEVVVADGAVRTIRVAGAEVEVAGVVSTAPANVLPKLVRGTDALDHLARFRFRPMVFVNLKLRGRGLVPDVVTWTPEARFPFFRLTEAPLSMPWLAPEGHTLLTVDIGCEKGDDLWSTDDAALGELCLDHVAAVVPDIRSRYLGCQVVRTPLAYPVLLAEYEDERVALAEGSGVDGLVSIGRNGEFAHLLMEDVYWHAVDRLPAWAAGLAPTREPVTS